MSEKYPLKRLCDVGVSLLDCVHNTPKPKESGYPYVAIPNIQKGVLDLTNVRLISEEDFLKWTKKTKPQTGDIILTRRARVGDTAVVPDGLECAIGQNLVILRSDGKQLSQKYLRWVLRSPNYWEQVAKYLNRGAVFDSLNCREIPLFELPVPSLDIQNKIASVLSSLDDKIVLNTRMNKVLEEMARALFHRWFVEFEFPNANGRPYKSAGGKMVDSEMGSVPEGWEVGTIGDVVNRIYSGGTPKTSNSKYWNGEFPWFSSGETRSHFVISTEKSITKDGVDNSSTKLANKHDIVIASAGQGFTRGQTSYLLLDTYVNQSVIVIHGDIQIQTYVYMSLSGRYNELRGISDSSSIRGSLTTKMIGKFPLIIPPRDLIEEYSKIIQSIIIQIENNLHENKRLTYIRDALIPKLISGDLSVPFPSTNDVGTGGMK